MLIVFTICFIAVLIVYLDSKAIIKNGLETAFILLALFFSIRYAYGNDYMGYYDRFKEFSRYESIGSLISSFYAEGNLYLSEIGWGIINYMFKPIGFPSLIAVLTFFELYVYYLLIRVYVPRNGQWLAVFTLVFSPQLLLIQLSMMRQALAIVLILLAIHLVFTQKKIFALFCVLGAVLVHKSAIFILPLFSIIFVKNHIGRVFSIILVLLFVVLYLSQDFLSNLYLLSFDNDLVSEYSQYESRTVSREMDLGLGFIIAYIPFFLLIRYLWHKDNDSSVNAFVFFAALSFSLAPISYVESLLGRFVFYFMPFKIMALPFAYYFVKNVTYRNVLLSLLILLSLYSYYSFMNNPLWVSGYSTYHTIFELL